MVKENIVYCGKAQEMHSVSMGKALFNDRSICIYAKGLSYREEPLQMTQLNTHTTQRLTSAGLYLSCTVTTSQLQIKIIIITLNCSLSSPEQVYSVMLLMVEDQQCQLNTLSRQVKHCDFFHIRIYGPEHSRN